MSGLGKAACWRMSLRLEAMNPWSGATTRPLAEAIGFMQNKRLDVVPSFCVVWRARRDSNARPLPSEGSTLSS